ncbi:hypothetical protein GOP47_0010791 [Adiantum capillus-veneris]|uniref:Protein kinase domain-containing protein n=1 Tax=Adiantum capillus-veneris TaxID=13818 RepID=A0A9D4ZJ48_ADICA|nr:hypothetical protein GOP47_0010791 [Adiantum capillus-veneris]
MCCDVFEFYRLGAYTHWNILELYDSVLLRASEQELPLFSQEATPWWWAIVAPMALSYLFATPGSLAGLADFVYAPIHARSLRTFLAEEVEIGRQLGEGSFGVVYEGFIGRGKKGSKGEGLHVVLKKAKARVQGVSEIHNSEIHMNHRLQRTASFACAEFLGTMQVKPAHAHGKLSEGIWLVWNFQGDRSLDYYLKQRNFPENLISMVLGKSVQASSKEEISDWNSVVIKTIFKQILTNLQDLHRSGVVHRDVKPLNLILDQNSGKFKFIDFGACVDLRSGFNYVPNETVIDPTYAAPEHYVMPTSTPSLPPDPLCSLVSPLLWHLNTPDRFDLYSAGLILMQLSMKSLRHDTGMQAFNSELKRNGYNLKKWRSSCRHGKDEFAFLDADGGAGWELVTALLQPRHDKDQLVWPSLGGSRPSASAALRHRFFHDSFAMPKPFPQKFPDPGLLHALPAFEGVAQNLSSAAKKVVYSSHKDMDRHTPEHPKDKKKEKASKFPSMPAIPFVSNAVPLDKQDIKGKGSGQFTGSPLFPNLSLPSHSDVQILKSSSMVKLKLTHALQGAFKGGLQKDNEKEIDILRKLQPASAGNDNLSGAFKGAAQKVNEKEIDTLRRLPSTSQVNISSKQQENNSSLRGATRSGPVFSPVGAALPTLTTSAVALATGWLVLSGLNSSAQASYEFGKLLMSSSGISGSAFLSFFLLIKPWLEEQSISPEKTEDTKPPTANGLQENIQVDKFRFIHSDHVKLQVVVDAMQELDLHMSALEAQLLEEQQVLQQQKELVQRPHRPRPLCSSSARAALCTAASQRCSTQPSVQLALCIVCSVFVPG